MADGDIRRLGIVGNEFATVEVSIDTSGRTATLQLRDVVSGHARLIDPLVLEALVFMDDEEMKHLADPNLIVAD